MKPKTYELLCRKWDYMWPVPETIAYWRQTDSRLGSSPDCDSRAARVRQKLFYPVLRHLGFEPIAIEDIREEVNAGLDLALEYFNDRWWRPEEMQQLGLSENDLTTLNGLNLPAMDKSRRDRQLKWYEAFTSALFLGGLSGRWEDLRKICAWFDATIEPEYSAGTIEDEYFQLFVCIAGTLGPQPIQGVGELLAKVKKCRTKRPRLLCAAWEAANAADQASFNKTFPETVKLFLSEPVGGQIYDWVAIDQSSVWLIAERRGLKFPSLSDNVAAAVVTRQSVGLAG